MLNPKSSLFLYLTSRQKSGLLGTLKCYVSNFPDLSSEEIIYKFLDDEKYYIDIDNPHFDFMRDYFCNADFERELKLYVNYLKYEQEQKQKLKPYIEKQKAFQKELRKRAQELKMSKLPPTKKQLVYYDKLIKNHGLIKKDIENASRLDLKNWITEIIDEYAKKD